MDEEFSFLTRLGARSSDRVDKIPSEQQNRKETWDEEFWLGENEVSPG